MMLEQAAKLQQVAMYALRREKMLSNRHQTDYMNIKCCQPHRFMQKNKMIV